MIWLDVEKPKDLSLTKYLCEQLRRKILSREVKAGEKLPSSRWLSAELGVSRNSIIEVYEQLSAEGYLESREGSGTYVSDNTYLNDPFDADLSVENETLCASNDDMIDFNSGIPDLGLFPKDDWGKHLRRASNTLSQTFLNYTCPAGIRELRMSVSRLLLRIKGIKCRPEQVVITMGASEAILILTKLLDTGYKTVLVEDPSYNAIRKILRTAGWKIQAIPADEKGICVHRLPEDGEISFGIVTPSHQFPLGSVLPVQRRIKLIEYARRFNVYFVENDYDGEFRYAGHPISSLYMLDPEHVIYVGTFSESMYPGIRLGYMIPPSHLVQRCIEVKRDFGLSIPTVEQLALSQFINEGAFERHLSRMKKAYQKKRAAIIAALNAVFGQRVQICGDKTGLYVVCRFKGIRFDENMLKTTKEHKIRFYTVEEHAIEKSKHEDMIILGYANLCEEEIRSGITRLKSALDLHR